METSREDYIKTGIDNKLPILQINKALSKGGFKPLTKAEVIMVLISFNASVKELKT